MRHNLYGFAQIITAPFFFNHSLINSAGGYVIFLSSIAAQKTLIMPQVQITFGSVFGHKTFTVLVRIERAGIYIQIRVKFLDSYPQAACLEQQSQGRSENAFAERRSNTARNKNIFGHCSSLFFLEYGIQR